MQNVRAKEPHLALSSDFKTKSFAKPASPLPVALQSMYVIVACYAVSQSQCCSEQCKWRDQYQQFFLTALYLCLDLLCFFLWGDSREKKRYLEAGNSCRETNGRSCLSWHWCLEKYLCNCCLQRVLLVNLSAPSECFCVFYSTQFWTILIFCLVLIYVIHCKSNVGDPTAEFPLLLINYFLLSFLFLRTFLVISFLMTIQMNCV